MNEENIDELIISLLDKYLKPNEELTPEERDYRNELISNISRWSVRVDEFHNKYSLEVMKDYNDRYGRGTPVALFESVDRWKTRSPADPLDGFHIKIKDYNMETKNITFSWHDGKDRLEDDLRFEEFEKRFEPWY